MIRIYPIVQDAIDHIIGKLDEVKTVAMTSFWTEEEIAKNNKAIDDIIDRIMQK